MASTLSRSNTAANKEADQVVALLDNGYLRIYSGTQPATADTALSGNTLLAELRFANPASGGAASGGLVTFAAISSVTAAATGTATFFRALKSDGTSAIMDGSVGVSGSSDDCIINSTAIASGASVSVTSFTYQATK
jgi:hypothetical protein